MHEAERPTVADIMGLAAYWAKKYDWILLIRHDVDTEDLKQAACIGILEALRAHDDARGTRWTTTAGYYVKAQIFRELLHTERPGWDSVPVSTDKPLDSTDAASDTLGDMLEDKALRDPIDDLYREDVRREVRAAIEDLETEEMRLVIRLKYFDGKSHKEIADRLGTDPQTVSLILCKAERRLRYCRHIRNLDYYLDAAMPTGGTGYQTFKRSQMSSVERGVIWRERTREHILDEAAGVPPGQ